MSLIDLRYGNGLIPFNYDKDKFEVIAGRPSGPVLSDAKIGAKLDEPIGSERLADIVAPGQSVLIVVPDATRSIDCGKIVNLVVRRLISNGINAFDIRIIFATGIHRKVTDEEKARILTPFIAQRIVTLDHDARNLMGLIRIGETSSGIPIEVNRALIEHDHVVIIGSASFHYFAGFTGGRKLICPGLASTRTISATHRLAFDCDTFARRVGVGTGKLDGNPVNEAFMEIVEKAAPAFSVTTIVNDAGEATDVYCGDWVKSHRAACDAYAVDHTVRIENKPYTVIVSCGGAPFDLNLIQANKALQTAAMACKEGGKIILVAQCLEGTGRDEFLQWFDCADKNALAERLCKKYQVNGQTAWSFLDIAERFNVYLISDLDEKTVGKLRCFPIERSATAIEKAAQNESGFIIPFGAKTAISCHL